MNNILDFENAAIAEAEKVLTEAGWSDAWGMTSEEAKNAPSPLFYRNTAPTTASEAKITIGDNTHNLYCIYGLADDDTQYSGNRPHHGVITIVFTFYYDDPFLFSAGNAEKENEFSKFIHALLAELSAREWAVFSDGESGLAAADDSAPYANRKVIFATKAFL